MSRSLNYVPLAVLLALSGAPMVAAVDPFYQARMEAGTRALEAGDWQEAAEELLIACFGYLDEPLGLIQGLVRLATAQAALEDRGGFFRTFSRIAELEERFSAYSEAGVPDLLRQRFESQAARLVPVSMLRSTGFTAIAERAERRQLIGLAPDQRRVELEERIRRESENGDWVLEMARLELEERRPRRALDWLDRLPQDVAGGARASCVRQQAATEHKDCARMDLTQPFCANVPAAVMEFRLTCLVQARRWPEAAALLEELPPQSLASRKVTRQAETVRRRLSEAESAPAVAPPPVPPPEPLPAADPAPSATPEAGNSESGPVVVAPRPDPAELADLRQRLARVETADDLGDLGRQAAALADQRPDSRDAQLLAAEVAYLLSDWPRAAAYYRRAGEPGDDEIRPSFYFAVALYELGDRAAAAAVLQPVVEQLERTPFVERYVDRILSSDGG